MTFFSPQKIISSFGEAKLDYLRKLQPLGEYAGFVSEWCRKRGIECGDGGNIYVACEKDDSENLTYLDCTRSLTDEKFIVKTRQSADGLKINITFSGLRSLHYALSEIARQMKANSFLVGEAEYYPLFKQRGYIEGFYGKPWSFDERADMLKLMAEHGMNTYYYAPKDDEYHRDRWSELYPEKKLALLSEIKEIADSVFVDFYFCIAPGLSMSYSSEKHYQALLGKLMQLYSIGIRNFGLLLDDIPEKLQYEEDIERFGGETVNAHIFLANRLLYDLKKPGDSVKITVCPLQYHGMGDEYFISRLGRGLEPEIDIFWTGRNICSQELTVREASGFIRATLHRPLYWDNFPVNDAEMCNEMHLGYLEGRESELYRYCEGLISNCMEFCECSKIPLLTVASYLWNPLGYEPEKSWEYALQTVAESNAEKLKYFAEHLFASCLKSDNSKYMCDAFASARSALYTGDRQKAAAIFSDYARKVADCCEMIEKNKEKKLFKELERWSEKLFVFNEILKNCSRYFSCADSSLRDEIASGLNKFMRLPETFGDFCFRETVELILKIREE